jgi:hypothetical protein
MFGLNGRQIFLLLMLVAILFAGAQYVPPYFDAYQFNDFVHQEVRYAGTARKTADTLRAEILQKAKEMELPLTKDNIRIERRGPSFTLDWEYHWPIDLKVYHHELTFHNSETGELFENAPN